MIGACEIKLDNSQRLEPVPLHFPMMTAELAITDAAFMRGVLAASDDCIKVLTLDGAVAFMSEGGQRVMEVSDFNAIRGCPWPDFFTGEGNVQAKAALESARRGGRARFQARANTAAGRPRWWDVQVAPIIDDSGNPISVLSVSRDITELKEAEQRSRLLALELSHRMKNGMAMIQAIAAQTFRSGKSLEEAGTLMSQRIAALARAQDQLTRTTWSSASLKELIESALEPFDVSNRISLSGPDIDLPASCAMAMGLAIHEMATNATKYGALSTSTGRIAIVWTVTQRNLTFGWTESGGPRVAQPESRGFGTRMLERALADYFSGTARLEFPPSGFVLALEGHLPTSAESGS